MNILIENDWIHTENNKGKTSGYVHLPKKIMKSLGLELPKENSKFINGWTREYFHKI